MASVFTRQVRDLGKVDGRGFAPMVYEMQEVRF
jgi:hypothetical protein